MVSTRSASSSPVKKPSSSSKSATVASKPPLQTGPPLKLVVAPQNISRDARILLLRHPRYSTPRRFIFCPQTGVYEFTRISASPLDPRSILFTASSSSANTSQSDTVSNGYVNKSAEYLTATPYDLSFLLINFLALAKNKLFQPLDDILEGLETEEKHFAYIVRYGRKFVEDAMSRICDNVNAGDEQMYRYSEEKVLKLLMSKASAACATGLPASLEDRFVTRTMQMPVLSVKREESSVSAVVDEPIVGTPVTEGESFDTQSTAESSAAPTVFSETSTATISTTTTVVDDSVPQEVIQLQRIRTVFNFMASSYLSQEVAPQLEAALTTSTSLDIDWSPLTKHLGRMAELKAEAAASRSFGDFSRKRGNLDDDEEAEIRAEKKRRIEDDEKRKKANQSRGVRELSKVNVSGMKKMGDFFLKKPATAKAKT